MGLYAGNRSPVRIWQNADAGAVYCSAQLVWQAADAGADWFWKADKSQVTLLSYRGKDSFVTIPSVIGGLPVTAIAATACDHAGIRMVTIPESILEIQ